MYERNGGRSTGGIVAFLATSTVTNDGWIGGIGTGFWGVTQTSGGYTTSCSETDTSLPFKGEGVSSVRQTLRGPGVIANGGGSGCAFGGGGGGGGIGRGANGQHPSSSTVGTGGVGSSATDVFGTPLQRLTFGGGGGGGHSGHPTGVPSFSGRGGGVVFIRARQLVGTGTIHVEGQGGDVTAGGTTSGGGGGGGGTAIVQTMGPMSCGGILADGGRGGQSAQRNGGNGGGGRIIVRATTVSCPMSVTSGQGVGAPGTPGVVQVLPPPPLLMTLTVPDPVNAGETTVFSGAATTGSDVAITIDGVLVALVTAQDWQWSYARVLGLGAHTISVRATSGGYASSSVTRSFTAAYRVPQTTIVSGPMPTSKATTTFFDFSSDVAGVTWRCSLDGAAFSTCTDPFNVTTGDGPHTLAVAAVNGGGVADPTPATRSWINDRVAPETTLTSTPLAATTEQTFTFTWMSSESGNASRCFLDSVFTTCASPFTIELPRGVHTFSVAAMDLAGNYDETPATFQWEALIDAPITSITSQPSVLNNGASVSFAFASTIANSTFECSFDSGSFAVCTSPRSYTTATSATHTFAVRARSPQGIVDATPVTHAWTTDRVVPNTIATSSVPARVGSGSVTFSFTSDEPGTFSCRLNSSAWVPCTSPRTVVIPANTTSSIEARAIDSAGNIDATPLRITTILDTIAPNTTITTAPSGTVTGTSFTFQFSATESSTFLCSFNQNLYAACTSPLTQPLGEGAHTLSVQATDTVGNLDITPATVSFVVDTTAPPSPAVSAPAPGQRIASTSLTMVATAATDATVVVHLDGVLKATGPAAFSATLTGLAQGAHTISVVARDAAGNLSPATTVTFTVDTIAPVVTFVAAPATGGTATTASFTFAADADVAGFACILDNVPSGACTSPYTTGTLAAGPHTMGVVATDTTGNVGTADHSWTIVVLPTAGSATVDVVEDEPVPITLTATGAGSLGWQVVTPPTRGTLSGTAPDLVYTPFADESGADAFSFVVVDSVGTSAPATIAIAIAAVDDAPLAVDATIGVDEDASVELALTGTDVDSGDLVFAVVAPTHGVLSGEAPDLVYTPFADFHGTDSFTFTVDDGTTISVPATISVTVAAINDAPVVGIASASTDEDTAVAFSIEASDLDDDVLVWTVTTPPGLGTVSGTGPAFVYTPNANASGIDVIGFTVGDGVVSIATTATVTITSHNDAPTALAQTVGTDEDTAVAITLQGADVDGDTLTFTIVTPPTAGTLSGTPPTLLYTPAHNSAGAEGFAFVVGDGVLSSPPMLVTIHVVPRNDAPFFVPPTPLPTEVVQASTATALVIPLAAFDIDGDALELAIVSAPASMQLVDGELLWTPTVAEIGEHEVVVAVDDGTVAIDHLLVVDVTLDDEDGDGLSDAWEIGAGLDPDEIDTDGDGIDDGTEVGDPDAPTDTDDDGIIDALDTRDDTPTITDTDGDGVADDDDVCPLVADNQADSNNDGIGDACTPPPPPPPQFVVTLQTQSSWQSGACYNGSVRNNGSAPGLWSGSVVVTGTINNAWNVNRIGNGNGPVTFSGVSWNQTAAPGTTSNVFGFCVSF